MQQVLVYGDSLTWGIVPDTRRRLPFEQRWHAAARLLGVELSRISTQAGRA